MATIDDGGLIIEPHPDAPIYHYENTPSNPSWAGALPTKQGLYDPEYEKDACGVGFTCHIKGLASHKIVSDARNLLCNLSHRGAVGADSRDGDGAGVMTSIPHAFFAHEFASSFASSSSSSSTTTTSLPAPGQYAVGNVFFSPDPNVEAESRATFEGIAEGLGLRVLGWRRVPRDSTLLGPSARSREPTILQPFVVLESHFDHDNDNDNESFDEKHFERQLFVLRKSSTHQIGLHNWFYISSLSSHSIVYKGQLSPAQVYAYYHDLNSHRYEAHFALVHSRFSTNTFPSWDRAQPMRWAAHNGEINTLRGNKNWQRAREGLMHSLELGDKLDAVYPIIEEGGSDSAAFDNVLELLVINGVLSLPEAVMVMVPEAWQDQPLMEEKKRGFYQWAACLMEPWDGPALFTFADGRYCGANLDRNGLRPCRYYILDDDIMIVASEVGTISVEPERVVKKGRLQPGRMLLVDTLEGRVVDDSELKKRVSERCDFQSWIENQLVTMPEVIDALKTRDDKLLAPVLDETGVAEDPRMLAFGYTLEQLNLILAPMAASSKEALGSMGNDGPLAVLATQPRSIYDYFRQLFAQVTNPPIDPIRESIVMSLECYVGPQGNVLEMNPEQAHRLLMPSPVLSIEDFNALKMIGRVHADWTVRTIDCTVAKAEGEDGYTRALDRICEEAGKAIAEGIKVIILSDRETGPERVALSGLLSCGTVHHHLVRNKLRAKVALVVETAEAREVHHLCVLLGYGADAICPYLAIEAILKLHRENALKTDLSVEDCIENFRHACDGGILKVMSKMGISTLQSYKGAQIFEALGLDHEVIDKCFAGTASRIKGATFKYIAQDAFSFHERGWPTRDTVHVNGLPESGEYHWRDGGDPHVNDPASIANLQDAVRAKNQKSYEAYSKTAYESIKACTLRGMLDFDFQGATPVPIEQVEPWTEIVSRFVTGAMSYGSISMESHSALAIAMNRLGGKSNTGEGGEDPERSIPMANGDTMRSAIKQVASGRFGVTSYYLSDSDELQIKMAQGAKPGEGGELPGHKVSQSIAKTRHSTPGVGLISPPPHHDIYSIEDLKQLIYDLKCSNPHARVSVKLVSEVGVGIVASGVAKAKADHILISGHDGGTGASRWTGIKYAGLPWELGLAETHQTLVLNDLRGRVVVQTDGQIRTGRDVAVACLLGAEEWGFATTPLIALGCIMMRKCHLNTCPVGVATQDETLRKKFVGQPEHVINFFYYVAEELRGIMAKLGFRTINEMVGRSDKLFARKDNRNLKTRNIDLSPILTPAFKLRPGAATYNVRKQDHRLYTRLDNKLIFEAEESLEKGLPTRIECDILNTDRALGATLSNKVSRKYGEKGLPADTIHVSIKGSAGQSFGAFLAPGITLELEGDANDYVGKGLSGGRLVIYPPKASTFLSEENIIIGNVCLYGATSGSCFFRGVAAERFAVRNSGATTVVEGVGDHGCEYMTGGRVVILGPTGRNFAAGMSGGIAYVFDMTQDFASKVNSEMIELSVLDDPSEIAFLRGLIEDHAHYTGSEVAQRILDHFSHYLPRFVKVLPTDYKRVLAEQAAKAEEAKKAEYPLPLLPENSIRIQHEKLQKAEIEAKKKEEAKVMDLEDSVMDGTNEKRKVAVLDKTRGFMKYKRQLDRYRDPKKRTKDWNELNARLPDNELKVQTARCMDCGVPFCQSDSGCPVSNIIPKWNELVFQDRWKDALDRLLMTNNFPEFTGRVCPAPCEGACVLGINESPVGIKSVELAIIEVGFERGYVKACPPQHRTGKKVAVIGSGPAGLAAADQLNKAGHTVTVYERADRPGGLLMYGIPNMKLDKGIVQRRLDLMSEEGVTFITGVEVGKDLDVKDLKAESDAIVVTTGATIPRDLGIPNRNLDGIHFAMQFLHKNTQSLLDSKHEDQKYIDAKDKHVIVIGGGDTGNDCIGTSVRHGAKSVTNFELLPQPPPQRAKDNPWPQYPRVFKVDYGHAEVQAHYGKDPREYCIMSTEFVSDGNGKVKGVNTIRVEWAQNEAGQWSMKKLPGTEKFFQADIILLAMGFLGPEETVAESLNLKRDPRTNIDAKFGEFSTSEMGVFAAGDCRRGQSLIVHAINEGRQAARSVDLYLMHDSRLPAAGGIEKRDLLKIAENEIAVSA
ncbi:glutamate synthase [NADH] [Saitoella coloradoensis]